MNINININTNNKKEKNKNKNKNTLRSLSSFSRAYYYYSLTSSILSLVFLLPSIDDSSAKEFITSLLVLDPMKRLTAEQCLEHPFLVTYSFPSPSSLSLPTNRGLIRCYLQELKHWTLLLSTSTISSVRRPELRWLRRVQTILITKLLHLYQFPPPLFFFWTFIYLSSSIFLCIQYSLHQRYLLSLLNWTRRLNCYFLILHSFALFFGLLFACV